MSARDRVYGQKLEGEQMVVKSPCFYLLSWLGWLGSFPQLYIL